MKFDLNKIVETIIFVVFFFSFFRTLLLRCYVFLRVARTFIKNLRAVPFHYIPKSKNAFSMHGSQFKCINTTHNSRVLKAIHDI